MYRILPIYFPDLLRNPTLLKRFEELTRIHSQGELNIYCRLSGVLDNQSLPMSIQGTVCSPPSSRFSYLYFMLYLQVMSKSMCLVLTNQSLDASDVVL